MRTIAALATATAVAIGAAAFAPAPAVAKDRIYYIAAIEKNWDYAPSFPINPMSGKPFTDEQKVFVEAGIGRTYKKSIYVETDANWVPRARGASDEHLGILGPTLRAEVGDRIIVHFKNMTSHPATMHPHGVFYDKNSEGAPYQDGTDLKADDRVAPGGGTHTYTWEVPERAGPGPNDPSSIGWLYHSHADEPADTNSGLFGAILISRKGQAKDDGSPKDVDREFISVFTVLDENASRHLDHNVKATGANPDADDFEESNLMHGINGLVYSNNTGYTFREGDKVRWYIFALGTEVDLHTPHWHGVTLLHNGHRTDVAEILPAAGKVYDLTADNPGIWMYHCHINDHITAGMSTRFQILARK